MDWGRGGSWEDDGGDGISEDFVWRFVFANVDYLPFWLRFYRSVRCKEYCRICDGMESS